MDRIFSWFIALFGYQFVAKLEAPAEELANPDISTYQTPFPSPKHCFEPQRSPMINPQQSGMPSKPIIMPPRKEKAADVDVSISIDPSKSPVRTLKAPERTSSSPISNCFLVNTPIQVESHQQSKIVNPIVKNLREQELGKAVFGYAIPITGLLIPFANNIFSPLFPIIIIALCVGLVGLWNGMLLRGTIPDKLASRLELFGAVCVLFAFFSVIGSFLPPELAWIVWVCFLICLFPLALSFWQVKEMTLL